MRFSTSGSALYYVKVIGALVILFVAFNYSWGYAQEQERVEAALKTAAETNVADSVVILEERAGTRLTLSWTIDPSKKISHFILERSTDGREYNEAALVFTGEHENAIKYDYSEKMSRPVTALAYYRLKAVGKDGKISYAPVLKSETAGLHTRGDLSSKQN